jgi:hypothetical protein
MYQEIWKLIERYDFEENNHAEIDKFVQKNFIKNRDDTNFGKIKLNLTKIVQSVKSYQFLKCWVKSGQRTKSHTEK